MADSIVGQVSGSGIPELENMNYLEPKQIWQRYCRSYSTFMKRLPKIIRKGGYREGAFRLIAQEASSRKRAYNQWQIHPVWGIEVLDKCFSPKK